MRLPSKLLKSALETAKHRHAEFFGFFNRWYGSRHLGNGGNGYAGNRPIPIGQGNIYGIK